ncbi:MAG: hypothetical protein HUJ61_02125 [Bacilli bacterium]|nr:hypothetical protein [Bacilli bacterium]
MQLFDFIPENFFSVLASKNKNIYAMALLVLYRSLQTDEMSIRKDDFVRMLKDAATDMVMSFDMTEEDNVDEEEEFDGDNNVNAYASLPKKVSCIVRRLEEAGWIQTEMRTDTFEEFIILPTYSIQTLTMLNEMVSDSETAYNSLVHSTFSELKLEDEEQDEFMYATLIRVYENTKKLKVELITLGHSIKMFQNNLGRLFSTNEVLHDHFDEYKVKVSDRLYHPLKTFDSVTKFKRPIVSILQKWMHDDNIRKKIVMQSIMWGKNNTNENAEADIIEKINYICDMYEQINTMIADIDQKHSEYTKSSANKIIYLNNSDKSIKGHLETIFKAYAKFNVESGTNGLRGILSRMQDAINITDQGYIEPDSITLPIIRTYRNEMDPMEIINTVEEAGDEAMNNFLNEVMSAFTDDQIYEFMETAFQGEDEIEIAKIPLPSFTAFALLILACLKKDDERCFYEIIMNEGKVKSQGYILPNFIFKRKENKENV